MGAEVLKGSTLQSECGPIKVGKGVENNCTPHGAELAHERAHRNHKFNDPPFGRQL